MKKRIVCIILSVVILTLGTMPVFATPTPRWSYTSSVIFNMYFDGEVGILEGRVAGYSDVTKIEGTITVYYKNILGIWTKTGDKWDVSTSSDTLYIDKDFDAESGKKYKAELDVDVYSGSNSENISFEATGTCP